MSGVLSSKQTLSSGESKWQARTKHRTPKGVQSFRTLENYKHPTPPE